MLYVRFLHLFPHFIDISAQYLLLSPVRTLLSFLSPSVLSAKLRSKAVYALSSTLQHSANAVRQLHEADGWDAFKSALEGEYRLSIHSGDRFMLTEKIVIDSDIGVRRKVAFLLNALLIPTSPSQPPSSAATSTAPTAPQGSSNTSTAVTLHPTASTTTSAPESNIQTPIYPNSHASMLADPSSASTSELTKEALESHGLLEGLVGALTSPVPHGPDGEIEGDKDFEDKIIA